MAEATGSGGTGLKITGIVLLLAAVVGLMMFFLTGAPETLTEDTAVMEPMVDPAEPTEAETSAPPAETDAAGVSDPGGSDTGADPETAGAQSGTTDQPDATAGDQTPGAGQETETAETAATEDAALPAAPTTPTPPSFDVVRVEPDGGTLVAGRADPGVTIELRIDGELAGQAQADATGAFVAMLDAGTSETPRALSLTADDGNGGRADGAQVVIIAPSPAAEETSEPRIAALDTEGVTMSPESVSDPVAQDSNATADGADAAEDAQTDRTEESSAPSAAEGSDAVEPEPAPEPEPEQPSVLLADQDGVRVLQDGAPEVAENVVIDAITYDAEGDVALSGRAPGEGFVRVYIDNEPVETSEVEGNGQWRLALPDVDTGVYTLRVDQVDAEGRVTSRAETPFRREAPEAIQELAEKQDLAEGAGVRVNLFTVQPGNTLWGISQGAYGDGVLYVKLFDANRDKIRNPDLIYPGQVFTVPN